MFFVGITFVLVSQMGEEVDMSTKGEQYQKFPESSKTANDYLLDLDTLIYLLQSIWRPLT